jgi:DNA-binding protein H-NS
MKWLDGNLTTLSPKERGGLMRQFVDILSPPELEQLRDLAEQKRQEREEEAKALLAEFRQRAERLGMSLETLVPPLRRMRRDAGKPLPVKYMSPDGQKSWAGRGVAPNWLKQLEAEGHNRKEYVVG